MAYINPITPGQWGTARTDQGVDYIPLKANTPVYALGNAVVTYSGSTTGWPGGSFIAYQLTDGPYAGQHVYVAEHLTNLVPVGTRVAAGQQIAAAQPGYPYTEWGWAAPQGDTPLTPYGGARDGTATEGGKGFARFLMSLGAPVMDDPGPGPIIPGNAATQYAGQTNVSGGASNTVAQVPGLNDIPALDAYIRQNFSSDAWLLDVPEVRRAIETAVTQGQTPDQVQATLENTAWWKHTSQAQVAFDQLKSKTPEELNFNDPGSKASAVLANIYNVDQQVGANLDPATMRSVALQALQYGWSNQQITQHLGAQVKVTAQGAGVTSNDPALLAQLTQSAGAYLYNPTQAQLQSYATGIASGQMSMDTFNAFLATQAATKYPSMAEAIKAGATPTQIIDPLRTEAAQTMGVAPGSLNFISDPTYSRILNYTPPPVAGRPQQPRVMTTSEMDAYLRGTNQYSYTQGARDQASDLSKAITTTLGKVAP